MSFIQNLALKLLGSDALAVIKAEAAAQARAETETKLRNEFARDLGSKGLVDLVGNHRVETFFSTTLGDRAAYSRQVHSALLLALCSGKTDIALAIVSAANLAEVSGEGFMKKKAAVLKVIKEKIPGISKSNAQLAIELAVQLIKD